MMRSGAAPSLAIERRARSRWPLSRALSPAIFCKVGIAAGVLANGIAALFVSALGTGTIALMLRSAWLLHWLNHGHQLTAIAAYRYEANASSNAAVYLFMLIWFPVIGLIMSALGAACTPLGRSAPGELTPIPATPR